ncbi:AAA family ATPase [Xanthomonas citri]
MTVLREIFAWSQTLPTWQSDAIARLLAQNQLSEQDEDDLLALLKASVGIEDPQGRVAVPLTEAQIPVQPGVGRQVLVHELKDLTHVNAIARNQTLTIAPSGLTVIYGDNGSGKSGYTRVLKRACRARDQQETVHPNANLEHTDGEVAQATFSVSIDGERQELIWYQGQTPPDVLSSISVFDSRCAKSYLEQEDDYAYVPYGLEIFRGLARCFERLKVKIDQEAVAATPDLEAFSHLRGDTQVGKVIATLSAKTSPGTIEELALLDENQMARRGTLRESLRENDPLAKAKQLRLRSSRVAALAARVNAAQQRVSESAIQGLRHAASAYRTAKQAAEAVAQTHQARDHWLPGTGGEVWQELYEAAKRFAVQAYPEKAFEGLDQDDACLLCQQPLGEGAARLRDFGAFIEAEAEKILATKKRELTLIYQPMSKVPVSLGMDEATELEMRSENNALADQIKDLETALVARQTAIVAAAISDEWGSVPVMPESPHSLLTRWTEQLDNSAKELEAASDEKARQSLQRELAELDARAQLGIVRDSVLSALEKILRQAKLRACLPALKTTALSNKASEIAQKVVSLDLAKALNQEFKALGVTALRVAAQSRSEKGKTLHRLRLELPRASSPSEILSEGEQRAIAIASFLAEVSLSGQSGGVVFDDPVCSLDHLRRERVATRLVQEAERRQVIVFTHDIYFLNLLGEYASRIGIAMLTQALTRRAQGFGVTSTDLPFEGKTSKQRVGALKDIHVLADKAYRQGEESEHRELTVRAYNQLRLAWERSVEEVLLRGVVVRFRKGIETQKLSGVSVSDEDYAEIEAGISKCSNYAHDKSEMGGVAVPEPSEVLADIKVFEGFIKAVQARGDATQASRKAGARVSRSA